MRPDEKEKIREWYDRLKGIRSALVDLRDDIDIIKDEHQEWQEERDEETDGKFADTLAGKNAEDDYNTLDNWYDYANDALDNLDNIDIKDLSQ